jgi:cellulose synthase/poly-beta-1,6-N-acetylglucosamine synthase-like glycosyltransferase
VLESILAQEEPDGGFEVILADGMSDDGTREILEEIARSDPRVKVIDNPGRIASTGLNAALRLARGQIIIRMDAHTHYASDYMRQCVSVLRSTGADNVGGPWVAQAHGYLGEAIAAAFQSPFAAGGARGHIPHYQGPVDTVYLGCWRREVFDRFGYFDEDLARDQDDEHNLRIVRGGGRVWQSPKIRSWYHPRTSFKGLFEQYLQYGYWKVQVIRKHRLPASWRHLVPGAFLLTLLLLCLAGALALPMALLAPAGSAIRSLSSWLLTGAWLGLASILSVYVLALVVASVHAAGRTKWNLLPILPLAFCCYHFGYGCGFLKGLLDFVILRRNATASFARPSREVGLRLL